MTSNQIQFIEAATEFDFERIAVLAREIWREHFTPIIGPGQVDYMLQKFQSAGAIRDAVLKENYHYYKIEDDGRLIGYIGIRPDADGSLFLSKLYIHSDYRGLGLSRRALAMLKVFCAANGLSSIWLTVNRDNSNAIAVYKHLGFVVEQEKKANIGNGYVMDDYIMRLELEQ